MTAGVHGTTFASFVVQNNHCINDGATIVSGSIPGSTIDHNVGMTNANATSQGYTTAETYVFSPTLVTNSTVGAGTNLSANCSGQLSSLCSDTVYTVSEQTVNGVVTAVASSRATVARPSTWDVGAYQYGAGTPIPTSPSCPTLLMVH